MPKEQLSAATRESVEEPGMEEQSVEQSVVTLMGEIGKHIEGQFQVVEGATENSVPVTSTTATMEEEDSERGTFTKGVSSVIPFTPFTVHGTEIVASGGVVKDGPTPNTPGGGATALFPCLVYYPNNNNYSLIWVPMDGSNPAISQAAAAAGSPPFQLPVQVRASVRQQGHDFLVW